MNFPRLWSAAVFATITACTSTHNAETGPPTARGDSKTVTETELSAATQLNLYDYVAAERPLWLRSRSPGSFSSRNLPIVIFVDDARLGPAETLKSVSVSGTKTLRYYEATAAQQKFRGRDIGPVIHVVTK
jgi:hypothetical protein